MTRLRDFAVCMTLICLLAARSALGLGLPPIITGQPTNQSVQVQDTATFSVSAFSLTTMTYQWYKSSVAIAGATASSYTITDVQAADAGTYAVKIVNGGGSVTSANATLTVYLAPSITTQPQSQTVISGKNASFSVAATGTAPLTYQWYFNGTLLGGPGNNNAVLTLNNVNSSEAGNYLVVVSNPGASVTSTVAVLTVEVQPTIQPPPPANQTVTQGQNATFSVTAAGTAPLSYQWYLNGMALGGATGNSLALPDVQASQAGNYTVVVTNSIGSVTSPIATLTVDVPPAITTQPQSQGVIQGDNQNAVFSVVAAGTAPLSYQWYFNGSRLPPDKKSSLTVKNPASNKAGSYTVVVNNDWGSVTSAVATLSIYVPPTIQTQPNNATVTQGQDASFSVVANGSAPFSYQWNFNGSALTGDTNSSITLTAAQATQAGSYTVVVTNGGGSVTSQVATLTVNVPPGITTQPQGQTLIQGQNQNASFSVVASGTAPLNYQWYLNGSAAGGGNNPTLTINNPQTNQAGDYTVVVQNNWGYVTSAVASLILTVPPSIQTQPNNLAVTQGQNASLSVVAVGTPSLGYQWNLNGSAVAGETNASITLLSAQPPQAGDYTVVVTNAAGSITSQVAALTVYVAPSISTQPQSQEAIQGQNQNISFSVVPGGAAPFGYQWNFNGVALSGETNAAVTLASVTSAQAGSYTVVVTNSFGGITSQVATLTVYVPPSITTQPQDQVITQVQDPSAFFSVVAAGTLPLTYQWYWNNALAADETNATLTLNEPSTNQAGSYTVVVQNNWGAVTSAVAVLTVYVAPAITNQPQSVAVFRGQNAALSVAAAGSAPLSYQWSFNDSALAADTNATLTLTNITADQAGSYTVLVSNPGGSVTSAVAIVTVTNPVATLSLPVAAAPTTSGFSLQVAAPVGVIYVILASSDLQTWTPIATNVSTNAIGVFTDPAGGGPGSQFYQVITP